MSRKGNRKAFPDDYWTGRWPEWKAPAQHGIVDASLPGPLSRLRPWTAPPESVPPILDDRGLVRPYRVEWPEPGPAPLEKPKE